MTRVLQKSNPFRPKYCGRDGCLICAERNGVDCRTRGVVYELWCMGCRGRYRVQTVRDVHCRGKEHVDENDEKAVVRRHRSCFMMVRKSNLVVKCCLNVMVSQAGG